jgi:hypothetical protein
MYGAEISKIAHASCVRRVRTATGQLSAVTARFSRHVARILHHANQSSGVHRGSSGASASIVMYGASRAKPRPPMRDRVARGAEAAAVEAAPQPATVPRRGEVGAARAGEYGAKGHARFRTRGTPSSR